MAPEDASAPNKPDDSEEGGLHGLSPGELFVRGLNTVRPSVGASRWEPPTVEELGRLLPQYRIERLIGRGGMGAVYKGIQINLGRPVAIKVLPGELTADREFVARFEREAQTLGKLQHSRIITIHDFGQTSEGHVYFVMEYIDGTNLRDILRGPGLNPEQSLILVGQLCDALQAAHKEGIVHRDIKPENVLVTRGGYVKLADFGLARSPEEAGQPGITQTDVVMGTPDYMAPEQRNGTNKVDSRSDIFALGVMLYEMLTGQTPPRGVFDPPSSRMRGEQVDVRIDEVVVKALQAEPDRRYQKVSEMRTDVDRIRTTPPPEPGSSGPVPVPATPAVPSNHSNHFKLIAAAIVVGAMLLAGAAIYVASVMSSPQNRADAVAPPAEKSTSAPLQSLPPAETPAPGRPAVANTASAPSVAAPTPKPDANIGTVGGAGLDNPNAPGQAGPANAPVQTPPSQQSAASPINPGLQLNEESFGGFTTVGDLLALALPGEVKLSSRQGRSGLISRKADFSKFNLHVELAGSSDVAAWIGVRVALEDGAWQGYTSYIVGRDGQVFAGHAGRNFATASRGGNTSEYEGGLKLAANPPDQFFSLDFRLGGDLWTSVNGIKMSGVGRRVPDKGCVGIFIEHGSLRVRKMEIRDISLGPIVQAPVGPPRGIPGISSLAAPVPPPAPPASSVSPAQANALPAVLFSHPWTWKAVGGATFPWNEVIFWKDGTMTTATTARARWNVTGPYSVALQFDSGDRIDLVFRAAFDSFIGARGNGPEVVNGSEK